ncbi:diguanylate cyclase [Alteromonas marina]|nr:hypothetical protein KUL113_23970 [Tenacibaculum sp. KUL113]
MSAWYRFTRLMVWLLLPLITCFSLRAQSSDIKNALRLEKLDGYSHIAATTIFHWNTPSNVSNTDITVMIDESGLQNDKQSEGVIFRHLLATSTANDVDSPRVPIFVKEPLLDKHWQELKALTPELFAAAKAYYIYARAVNDFDGSSLRISETVPALRRLKLEALDTGSKTATAIASIWLAMELNLANPIEAINELEYALAHLPHYSPDKNLQNALSKTIAHDWLRDAYLELFVPSRAFYHSQQIIDSKKQAESTIAKTWAFFSAIDALLVQDSFNDALALVEDAIDYVSKVNSAHEKLLIYVQKLRAIVFQKGEGYESAAQKVMEQIRQLDTSKMKERTQELSVYADALYAAVLNDEAKFNDSLQQYKKIVLAKTSDSSFKEKIKLKMELELSRLYDAAGNYEKAYEHSQYYNKLLVAKNTEQFKFSSSNFRDNLAEDIELAHYRQKELASLREQKEGLSTDKEAMKTTIFVLLLTILLILVLWLWVAKKQSDLLAERDSLTGALTRRAMLNSLKKSLKSNKTSSIALLDVDNFKKINDRYGHAVGDEVLTTITQIIKNRIRKSDKLCRYGGEEFLIYFSDTDEKSAKRILDELNVALSRQKHWNGTDEKFCVSFSSGLLDVKGETNLDRIIKACDDLLYKAKRDGRARVASLSF